MKETEKVLFEILALVAMVVVTVESVNAGCIGEVTDINYGCGDTVIENCTFSKNLSCMTQYGLLINNDEFEEAVKQLEDCTSKRFVYLFLDGLSAHKAKHTELNNQKPVFTHLDLFSINLEKLRQKLEIISTKSGRTKE